MILRRQKYYIGFGKATGVLLIAAKRVLLTVDTEHCQLSLLGCNVVTTLRGDGRREKLKQVRRVFTYLLVIQQR